MGERSTHGSRRTPSVVVLAPAPLLTVTVESSPSGDEVHFHPGGQGAWIARLVSNLDIDVVLCSTFGGESGMVVQGLLENWGIDVRSVPATGWNGVYVHDRRSGERCAIAEMDAPGRSRHEVDELYGAVFVAGLEADVVVLGGPETSGLARGEVPELLPLDFYTRLARDLHRNGKMVVADLSGQVLGAAVEGGIDLVKVSDEELLLHGEVSDSSTSSLVQAMAGISERGAESVVVTCAERPTLALVDGAFFEISSPKVDPIDDRGAGDSVTAGMVAALARAEPLLDAVRLGAAAGALNVTRRGLGSGSRREIELLAQHIMVRELGSR